MSPLVASATWVTIFFLSASAQDYSYHYDYDGGFEGFGRREKALVRQSNQEGGQGDFKCTSEGFHEDPNDCKRFYRCVNYGDLVPYQFQCPPGTVYEPQAITCVHYTDSSRPKCRSGLPDYGAGSSDYGDAGAVNNPPYVPPMPTQGPPGITYQPPQEINNIDSANNNWYPKPTVVQPQPPAPQQPVSQQPLPGPPQSVDSQMPNENKCTSDGFFGVKGDCRSFYRCVNNGGGSYTKYDFQCTAGTVWDPVNQACNHAWAVSRTDCKSSNEIAPPTGGDGWPDQSQSSNNNPNNNYWPNESSGSNEINGPSYPVAPSYPNMPNQPQETGNYSPGKPAESNVPYQPVIPSSPTPSEGTPGGGLTNPNSECTQDGFFGVKGQCRNFYRCVNNGQGYTKYDFQCSSGTVWDDNIQSCNHAWAARRSDCQSESSGTDSSNEITSINQERPPKPSVENQMGPQPVDGSYKPVNTNNPYQPPSSNQPSGQNQENTSQGSSNIIPESNKCESEGFFGVKGQCRSFYRCVNTGQGFTRYDFQCSSGTVWDQENSACNHAWAVQRSDCKDDQTNNENEIGSSDNNVNTDSNSQMPTGGSPGGVSGSQTSPPQNPFEPSQINPGSEGNYKPNKEIPSSSKCTSEGFFGVKGQCQSFYRCVNDGSGSFIKYEFQCTSGTVWDQNIESCNHPWAVNRDDCKATGGPVSSGNEPLGGQSTSPFPYPPQSTSSNEEDRRPSNQGTPDQSGEDVSNEPGDSTECSSEGFYPVQGNCKRFVRCVSNGDGTFTKFQFTCGEGTAWDTEANTCNHENLVIREDCGGRTTPSLQSDSTIPDNAGTVTTSWSNSSSSSSSQSTSSSSEWSSTVTQQGSSSTNQGGSQSSSSSSNSQQSSAAGGSTQTTSSSQEGSTASSGSNQQTSSTASNQQSSGSTTSQQSSGSSQQSSSATTSQQQSSGSNQQTTSAMNNNQQTSASNQQSSSSSSSNNQQTASTSNQQTSASNQQTSSMNNQQQTTSMGGQQSSSMSNQQQTTSMGNQQTSSMTGQQTTASMSNQQTSSTSGQQTTTTGNQQTSSTSNQQGSSTSNQQGSSTSNQQGSSTSNQQGSSTSNQQGSSTSNQQGSSTSNQQGSTGSNQQTSSNNQQTSGTQTSNNSQGSSNQQVSSGSQTSNQQSNNQGQGGATQPMQPSTTPKPAMPTKDCSSEGFFPVEGDCNKFYRCVNSGGSYIKYDFACGPGTVWDPEITSCNHPWAVKGTCSSNPNQQQTGTGSQQPGQQYPGSQQPNQPQQPGPQYPGSQQPGQSGQQPGQETPGQQSNRPPSSSPGKCEKEGFFAIEGDCTKFYRCVDNGGAFTKYDFNCGPGTVWDQENLTCNHPWAVTRTDCGNSQVDNNVIPGSTGGSSQTQQPGNQIPNQTTQTPMSTGSQQTPNQPTGSQTQPPGSGTTAPEGARPCERPQSTSQITCTQAGFFPHPDDCKKFYRCVDWDGDKGQRFSIYFFECGEGTIFDPALNVCNHAESVQPPRNCQGASSSSSTTGTTNGTTSAGTTPSETAGTTMGTTGTVPGSTNVQTSTESSTNTESTTAGNTELTSQTNPITETTSPPLTVTSSTEGSTDTESTQTASTSQPGSTQTTSSQTGTTQTGTTQTESAQTTGTSQPGNTQTTSSQTGTTQTGTTQTESPQTTGTSQPGNTQTTSSQTGTTQTGTTLTESTQPTTSQPDTTQTTSSQTGTTQTGTTLTESTQTTTNQPGSTPTSSSQTGTTQSGTTQTETSQIGTTQTITDTTSGGTSSTNNPTDSTGETGPGNTGTESTTAPPGTTQPLPGQTSQSCPPIESDQYMLVCPTGFRRHPKYCNMFYQCTTSSNNQDAKILTLTCPNGTVYDEGKLQCLPQNEAAPCQGELAERRLFKRMADGSIPPIEISTRRTFCPTEGSFPYDGDCQRFIKCNINRRGRMEAYMYQCPEGYSYWDVSRRCERLSRVPRCLRGDSKTIWETPQAPLETKEIGY